MSLSDYTVSAIANYVSYRSFSSAYAKVEQALIDLVTQVIPSQYMCVSNFTGTCKVVPYKDVPEAHVTVGSVGVMPVDDLAVAIHNTSRSDVYYAPIREVVFKKPKHFLIPTEEYVRDLAIYPIFNEKPNSMYPIPNSTDPECELAVGRITKRGTVLLESEYTLSQILGRIGTAARVHVEQCLPVPVCTFVCSGEASSTVGYGTSAKVYTKPSKFEYASGAVASVFLDRIPYEVLVDIAPKIAAMWEISGHVKTNANNLRLALRTFILRKCKANGDIISAFPYLAGTRFVNNVRKSTGRVPSKEAQDIIDQHTIPTWVALNKI